MSAARLHLLLVLVLVSGAGCSPLLYALLGRGEHGSSGHELAVGRAVDGATDDDQDSVTLSCGSPDGAGDESWTFVPPVSGPYRFTVNGQYDCALGVFGPGEDAREVGCNDDSGTNNVSQLSLELQAGARYVVVVDGYRGNEGAYRLAVEQGVPGVVTMPGGAPAAAVPSVVPEDAATMQPRCDAAPMLAPGVTRGGIAPEHATARTSCGSGPGGDAIYRLTLGAEAQVTIKLEASFDGILELRAGCSPGPVLACNDDAGDALHSAIVARVPAGTYFIVVDSYHERLSGPFDLQLIVDPI